MITEYKVSSGGWKATVEAASAMKAVVKALKRDKPKKLGIIIQIDEVVTSFVATETAVRKAGSSFKASRRREDLRLWMTSRLDSKLHRGSSQSP